MNKLPKNLTSELDRKRLTTDIEFEFLRLGQTAYDGLKEAIEARRLTNRQTANALRLLQLLTVQHCFAMRADLHELALGLADDERIEVRTQAIAIAIGMTLLKEHFPQLRIENADRSVVAPVVERGLEKGLKPYLKSYA